MARRRRGHLGSIDSEHVSQARSLLESAEGFADSAERVLRGGDCRAAMDSLFGAIDLFGEASAHARSATKAAAPLAARRVRVGVRIQKLRTAVLRSCVR